MTYINPLNLADSYKVGHHAMYDPGMTHLQSNWTARGSRIPDVTKVVAFGIQAFLEEIMEKFREDFFQANPDTVILDHQDRVQGLLQMPFDVQHWYDLHDLGYLPLEFRVIKEGTEVPLRVPMMTITNTVPGYGWLVNYFESVLSNQIWLPMTSATIALRVRRLMDKWAAETSDTPEFVDWQGHDFSFRGMENYLAGAASGAGHLLSFAGSDTLTAMDWARECYGAEGFVGGSVPATEHSVMCVGGEADEFETYERLIKGQPTGLLSIVSDTWDLWHVITDTLAKLKDEILARDGKIVIRPDSGDPVDILCGDPTADPSTPAYKGVVELLGDVFGYTTNSKGYKVLDPHIGTIYGDSITYERAEQIFERLAAKGWASTNPVLGIGSFTYQYNTRDTFGFAMKATWAEVNGESRDLFKDPVTDDGLKRSAKGRCTVVRNEDGELVLMDQATKEQVESDRNLLVPVWRNGRFTGSGFQTFHEIAERVGVRHLMPA